MNSNENNVAALILNPDDSHWSKINLVIKSGLLLLVTKKGSDNLNLAFEGDFEVLKNGISKYTLSSPINLIKDDI